MVTSETVTCFVQAKLDPSKNYNLNLRRSIVNGTPFVLEKQLDINSSLLLMRLEDVSASTMSKAVQVFYKLMEVYDIETADISIEKHIRIENHPNT